MPQRHLISVLVAMCAAFLAPLGAAASDTERATSKLFTQLRDQPAALRVFLHEMPKGGDLHNHLDGSIYAEDYLAWAGADGFCINKADKQITPPPCASHQVSAQNLSARDPVFYQAAIDALSMRSFVPGTGTGETSGHDHGFATFRRFGAVAARHLGDMLGVTRQQAARDHVSYIEQIADPSQAFTIASEALKRPLDPNDLASSLTILAPQLTGSVNAARAQFTQAEATMRRRLHCEAQGADPGCNVKVRYLYFVLRTQPPASVFAQMALGYALVAADSRFVGLNLVGPEDDPVSLRDFALHMAMFRFFQQRYPGTKLSLHAGELTLGLVPPADLRHHIHDSVEIAGARRIGHGYGIPYEDDAARTLALMARERIAIEINLTSNAITPGIRGAEHPFRLYRRMGIPAVLAADDEGVFRIDMTHEFLRAALEHELGYVDLKDLARNSITFSFLTEPEKSALRAQLENDFALFEQQALKTWQPLN